VCGGGIERQKLEIKFVGSLFGHCLIGDGLYLLCTHIQLSLFKIVKVGGGLPSEVTQ